MTDQEKDYYGTKRIKAFPAVKYGEPNEDGYTVIYPDGYRSWSPKDVFEAAYQPIDALNFGHALTALKEGHRVARAGWNGKGMFLIYMPEHKHAGYEIQPHIVMKTVDGTFVPWLCSQTDALADDWCIVEALPEKLSDLVDPAEGSDEFSGRNDEMPNDIAGIPTVIVKILSGIPQKIGNRGPVNISPRGKYVTIISGGIKKEGELITEASAYKTKELALDALGNSILEYADSCPPGTIYWRTIPTAARHFDFDGNLWVARCRMVMV